MTVWSLDSRIGQASYAPRSLAERDAPVATNAQWAHTEELGLRGRVVWFVVHEKQSNHDLTATTSRLHAATNG